MGTRLTYRAARTAVLLPLVTALTACATTQPPSTGLAPAGREAVAERGPRVRIWTTDEVGTGLRVRASFRLDDDAYVAVVNVRLDGYASVIFPESPSDDGFMRGGRTYRLPSFFPGFANHFHYYHGYRGYVFIIASWRPMAFGAAEELGLWDEYRLAEHERQLQPYEVMHHFARRLVAGRPRDYSAYFARYSAFGVRPRRASSFASCLFYGSTLGSFPWWTFHGAGSWRTPVYAFGHYGAGSRCGDDLRLVGYRTRRTVGTPPAQPAPPPVRPAPPPGSHDSAAAPKRPRRPRKPVVVSDSGARESPARRQVAEEETIIDVTHETRDLARRRDRDADRTDRAIRRQRGYGTPDDGAPSGRRRTTERAGDRWDADRGQRGRRAPVDDDARSRARAESARGDQRPSEARREPPRPVERSEPRQNTRPQPAPRSEPAARPEPRAERQAKPIERQ